MKHQPPVRELQYTSSREETQAAADQNKNGKTKKKHKKQPLMKDNSGKIILALIAGASAGVIAGLLMAPETGEATRGNLRKSATKLGKDLEGKLQETLNKLESLNLHIPGLNGGSKAVIKGDWNEMKGKLRQRYGQLTDDDLAYAGGSADELYGNLQRALGMSRMEVEKMLNEL